MSIKEFTDLVAWQKACDFVVLVYEETKNFPKDEIFGLTSQIHRAAVSVSSNIAEGFGRRSAKDRIHFYDMARASLSEVQNQLIIAMRVGYLSNNKQAILFEKSVEVSKIISGLIKSTK